MTDFKQYELKPDETFNFLIFEEGQSGWDFLASLKNLGWFAMGAWGKDGHDLGEWPLDMVFTRNTTAGYKVLRYTERNLTQWLFPDRATRNKLLDEIAFSCWKREDEYWVSEYNSIDEVPEDSDLRGPMRWDVEEEEENDRETEQD